MFCLETNAAFKAVLSRVDVFHLSATNDEIIEQMRLLAAKGYHDLTPERCIEVVDSSMKAEAHDNYHATL